MSFLLSSATVPTWWTQYPAEYPLLTGWYAGPKADRVAALSEDELVTIGLASLAEIFGVTVEHLRAQLVAARALNWGVDPFARGAYTYAVVGTRAAQAAMKQPAGVIYFSGEALYDGPDIGTVEAALASGRDTARMILVRT
jgi:monoamine oxidase